VTLADGTFDLGAVPSGETWLSIATPNDTVQLTRTRHFTTAPDEGKYVEIARETGFVRGTLTGAAGDSKSLSALIYPDPGSAVDATDHLLIQVPLQTVTPDPDGDFAFGPLVTGAYLVIIERRHDDPRRSEFVVEQPTRVVVTRSATTSLAPLVLLPEVPVTGRVELPPDPELSKLIVRHGLWFARDCGAQRTGGTAELAKDLTFSLQLVPNEYVVGTYGVNEESHVEADAVVVPSEGVKDVVIRLRKSGR